ncbi:MarR family transcriptional regulator [Saccharomonospora sp. NPDC006951]
MESEEGEARLSDLFLRLARRTRVTQMQRLGPLGLTPAQARALSVIGHCSEPPRMAELAARLGVVPRAVTPLIDALEQAGFVRRRIDECNRRSTLLELTEEGHRMCLRLRAERAAVVDELFSGLTPAERDTLVALLDKVGEEPR